MAEIELGPLSDRLDDDEMKTLRKLLDQAGARLGPGDDHTTHAIAKRLSEDAMTEFLDRLEAHDMAADIYLPLEFDGRLHVGELRVASAVSRSTTGGRLSIRISLSSSTKRNTSLTLASGCALNNSTSQAR